MRKIPVREFTFSEQWHLDFDDRFKMLLSGTYRIAYYSEAPNCSSFRYRVFNMVESINSENTVYFSASYFFEKDAARFDQIITNSHLLIIHRSGINFYIEKLINLARQRKIRVLFDTDDLVYDPSLCMMLMETIGQNTKSSSDLNYWYSYVSRMRETLNLCDGSISTNEILSDNIKRSFGIDSVVIPNFMNKQQEEYSREVLSVKKKCPENFDLVELGYFSGSPSHQIDFKLISHSLSELFDKDKKVSLTLVGYIELPNELTRHSDRIAITPFTDYVNLQRLIASVDINLVPLQSNLFTSCKSPLKVFEASYVETLSIASNTNPYSEFITSDIDGYLCKSHEWTDKIEEAIGEIRRGDRAKVAMAKKRSQDLSFYEQKPKILNNLKRFMEILE